MSLNFTTKFDFCFSSSQDYMQYIVKRSCFIVQNLVLTRLSKVLQIQIDWSRYIRTKAKWASAFGFLNFLLPFYWSIFKSVYKSSIKRSIQSGLCGEEIIQRGKEHSQMIFPHCHKWDQTELMQPHISFKSSMQKRPCEVRPIQESPQNIFMTVENYEEYSCFIHEL